MHTNRTDRTAANGQLNYPSGLAGMLVLGLAGAYIMPEYPKMGIFLLLGVAIIAVTLLTQDKPVGGPRLTGAEAMRSLLDEIEYRSVTCGEKFNFAYGTPERSLTRRF